jgi:PKD repeat protein
MTVGGKNVRAKNLVRMYVWNNEVVGSPNGEWVDVTDGLVSFNSKTGYDSFDGFWDQPDTGLFTIISRGPTVDPHINELIKTNRVIKISTIDIIDNPYVTSEYTPFIGFITDVNVEYRKGDTQLVTINGTDLMGYLNRLVVTQDFIDTNITPEFPDNVVPLHYLLSLASYQLDPQISSFFNLAYSTRYLAPGNADKFRIYPIPPNSALLKIEPGQTFYELICQGMSSASMVYENYLSQYYNFYPNFKYDPLSSYYPDVFAAVPTYYLKTNSSDPWINDIEPNDFLTFKYISLNDGFNKIVNQVSVTNTNPKTAETLELEPFVDTASTTSWGPAKLTALTTYTTTTNPFWLDSSTIANQALQFQNDIIDYQSEPKLNIESITIDMLANFDKLNLYTLPDNETQIYIQHRVSENNYITGYYTISGVRHIIDESIWYCEFILRNSETREYIDNQPKAPIIAITADGVPADEYSIDGTTATTFVASISNYTSEDWDNVESVEWMVNSPFVYEFNQQPSQIISPNKANGFEGYFDGYTPHIFDETTATWTYDDSGILSGFPSDLYGPGIYVVQVWVTGKNGYKRHAMLEAEISITAATAHADFNFSKDAQERVTFFDTSGPDTNTWNWNFGDGTTYSGKTPPVKQYTSAGTYNVTLTVDNGYDTDTITKPITINVYQIPVQYVRLRYQGTVTRPAGATEYPVDLIDTIGLVELINNTNQQMGGIQPFYLGRVGTLEKVQELSKGNGYQWLRILDDPITKANHEEWIYQSSPLDPNDPIYPYSPYAPNYITDYSSGGPLDPMSQTHLEEWTDNAVRGTVGGTVPKYRFIPVVTDNPDGSQTKSIDIDINIWYSQTYITGSKTSSSSSVYRNYRNNAPAGSNSFGPTAETYLPAGRLASLAYWNDWGTGTGLEFNQATKLSEVKIWPGMDTKVKKTTSKQLVNVGTNQFWMFSPPVDPPLDRFGVQEGKTYLPISIAVSDDGVTFRKIGEAEYVSGNTLTTTYDVPMPPFSSAPIEP